MSRIQIPISPPNYKKPLIEKLAVFFRLEFSGLQQPSVYSANLSSKVQIPKSQRSYNLYERQTELAKTDLNEIRLLQYQVGENISCICSLGLRLGETFCPHSFFDMREKFRFHNHSFINL